jgi:hypothetical protein
MIFLARLLCRLLSLALAGFLCRILDEFAADSANASRYGLSLECARNLELRADALQRQLAAVWAFRDEPVPGAGSNQRDPSAGAYEAARALLCDAVVMAFTREPAHEK